MKVLHVTFSFPPDPPGGTELYVDALARHLDALGVKSVIAAPAAASAAYETGGLRVRRFATSPPVNLTELYAGSDNHAANEFDRVLEEEQPDILHQHALTHGCSIELIRRAKARGARVVFTYHTPTVTCQRGTLLESGTVPCDGRLEVSRCTSCTLDGLGAGPVLSRVLAMAPLQGGQLVERLGREGGAWTAVRMKHLMRRRQVMLRQFFHEVDRFVVLSPWTADVLRINGVAAHQLVHSRHGVDRPPDVARRARRSGDPLRLAHLGRVDPTKGTSLLVRAVKALPESAPVELDIYGTVQHASGDRMLEDLRSEAGGDRRIRFFPRIAHDEVPAVLARYDLLVVPSQWLETGPLVVLEAFSAGLPVIGSGLGGILDKVTDGVDGILVRPFDSVTAWTAALLRVVLDPDLANRLAAGVRPPRPATAVAAEMQQVYSSLLDPAIAGEGRAESAPEARAR